MKRRVLKRTETTLTVVKWVVDWVDDEAPAADGQDGGGRVLPQDAPILNRPDSPDAGRSASDTLDTADLGHLGLAWELKRFVLPPAFRTTPNLGAWQAPS